jgi:hypothetical protein
MTSPDDVISRGLTVPAGYAFLIIFNAFELKGGHMPQDDTSPKTDEFVINTQEPLISDKQFIEDLNRLKELRSFLIREAVRANFNAISFGKLNLLRYSETGRPPTADEWEQVEHQTHTLFNLLSDPLRKKFLLGEVPPVITLLPLGFGCAALLCLLGAIFVTWFYPDTRPNILPFYLVWILSLGAIGAIAFIGMNVLSVQEDITFDVSNKRLMLLRVILGGLFGLVLTLPFGFDSFREFCKEIASGSARAAANTANTKLAADAVLLLLPFILGFSTSLVIMVLNRFVDAVQTFFGRNSGAAEARPMPTPSPAAAQQALPTAARTSTKSASDLGLSPS